MYKEITSAVCTKALQYDGPLNWFVKAVELCLHNVQEYTRYTVDHDFHHEFGP